MKNYEKLFNGLLEGYEHPESDDNIVDRKIDEIENRLSSMIDKKLSSLGQNTEGKGEDEEHTTAPTGDSTDTDEVTDTDEERDSETDKED